MSPVSVVALIVAVLAAVDLAVFYVRKRGAA